MGRMKFVADRRYGVRKGPLDLLPIWEKFFFSLTIFCFSRFSESHLKTYQSLSQVGSSLRITMTKIRAMSFVFISQKFILVPRQVVDGSDAFSFFSAANLTPAHSGIEVLVAIGIFEASVEIDF